MTTVSTQTELYIDFKDVVRIRQPSWDGPKERLYNISISGPSRFRDKDQTAANTQGSNGSTSHLAEAVYEVDESCLLILFRYCFQCHKEATPSVYEKCGASVTIRAECPNGHFVFWSSKSQPAQQRRQSHVESSTASRKRRLVVDDEPAPRNRPPPPTPHTGGYPGLPSISDEQPQPYPTMMYPVCVKEEPVDDEPYDSYVDDSFEAPDVKFQYSPQYESDVPTGPEEILPFPEDSSVYYPSTANDSGAQSKRYAEMACDPNLYEFSRLTANEELAISFAKQNGLLLSDQHLKQQQQQQQQQHQCLLGTQGCKGIVSAGTKTDGRRGKVYQGFRCSQCKKFRSSRNAIVHGEIQGAGQEDLRTFFASVSADAKSHTKLSFQALLRIIYCWAKDLTLTQTKNLLGDMMMQTNTLVDWRRYLRKICERALEEAPPMGGPGQVIQIDESLMRGWQKYNRGRLLQGNRAPPSRNNYGTKIVGPWIFGMVWKRPDGTQELRMLHVLRRNEQTLRAIIQRNIAPGTEIWSDQLGAYANIPHWPGFNYTHRSINHQQNFIDPVTGDNTQRIEANWGHAKTEILQKMRGTSSVLLPGYLAEYWWKKVHQKTPFNDLIAEIAHQFPLI